MRAKMQGGVARAENKMYHARSSECRGFIANGFIKVNAPLLALEYLYTLAWVCAERWSPPPYDARSGTKLYHGLRHTRFSGALSCLQIQASCSSGLKSRSFFFPG